MTTTTSTTGAHHSGGLPARTTNGRIEGVVQVVIMFAVAAMAGAASFRHVHDWTMHNSPPGTGDWFGWANAMVSELIPLAAGLEARRRRRLYGKAGAYPIALILAAVVLSLTGQFAEANPGVSGWVISAVPALGFLALVKLVLSGPTTPSATAETAPTAGTHASSADLHEPPPPEAPALVTPEPTPATPDVPAHLLTGARFALAQHEQATGRPISVDELAARMSLTPAVAAQLLTALGEPTTAGRINGTPVLGGQP